MVLLHVKRSDEHQFLYETTVGSSVATTLEEVVTIHNLRQKITKLKLEGEELAKYGPAKQSDKQGIDTYSEEPVEKGPHYTMDPTGRRTGNACDTEVAKVLMKTLEEATEVAHKRQVERKVSLTKKMLDEALDNVRGAVMICYPMGLPQWDMVRGILDEEVDGQGQYGTDDLDPAKATMWFAGKQMAADAKLSDYLGRHEKTKAVVKLQGKGQGAPSREPAVDQETQKAMLAWYYKQQEKQKELAAAEDDSYHNSAWADPKSLKSHFSGVGKVVVPRC